MSSQIRISNFNLFSTAVKSLAKLTQAAKFVVSQSGFTVYSKNGYARFELSSNALESDSDLQFCIGDMGKMSRVVTSFGRGITDKDGNQAVEAKLILDKNSIQFSSSKMKVKLMLVKEDIILSSVVSEKVSTKLSPVFTFKTSSKIIRGILGNSYLFSDSENIRIKILDEVAGMEKNTAYSKMCSSNEVLNNEIISPIGLVTFGKLDGEVIIDPERLSIFNVMESEELSISLMDKPFLVSEIEQSEDKNYLRLCIYDSIRKS